MKSKTIRHELGTVFFITNRNSVFVGEELAPPVAPNLTFLTTLANPALSLASYCYAEFAFSDLIFREGQAFLITNF